MSIERYMINVWHGSMYTGNSLGKVITHVIFKKRFSVYNIRT